MVRREEFGRPGVVTPSLGEVVITVSPRMPQIDGYELVSLLGRGGMGEVYLARQIKLDRLVAIKLLKPDSVLRVGEPLERFRREAELMARVSHPYVLSVHDSGDAEGRPFLVMEYVQGGDL